MSDKLKDYLSILVMVAFTGFFYVQTSSETAHGGAIFPTVVMGLMIAMAALSLAQSLLYPKSGAARKEKDPAAKANRPRFWIILASIVLYIVAVDYIGFYVSSFAFFFGLTVAVQYEKRTLRGLAVRLLTVTCFMAFLYVLFTMILLAQLPKGMLF